MTPFYSRRQEGTAHLAYAYRRKSGSNEPGFAVPERVERFVDPCVTFEKRLSEKYSYLSEIPNKSVAERD
jgi:hypothetical protein